MHARHGTAEALLRYDTILYFAKLIKTTSTMNKASPQTMTNDLIKKVSSYNLEHLPSEFEVKLLLRDAEKLKTVNPAEGWMLSGIIYSFSKDSGKSVAAFEKALALSTDQFNVVLNNYVWSLELLGQFDIVGDVLKKYVSDDDYDLISFAISVFMHYGLIDDAINYQKKLNRFNVKNSFEEHLNNLVELCSQLKIAHHVLHEIYLLS